MQDALLIYYMIANFMQAGCLGGLVEAAQQAMKAPWHAIRAAVAGTGNKSPVRIRANRPRAAVCAVQADWAARLTRLDTYVAAMA